MASKRSLRHATAGYGDLVDALLALPHCSDAGVAETAAPATEGASAVEFVLAGDVDGLALLLRETPTFRINARSPHSGRALVHEACAQGHKEIVKLLLLKTEADLMLRTMLGRCTPLHLAVTNNHRSIVFLLLSHGADALSRDRFGSSPLHYVKSLSVAKLLVQYGAKVLDYNAKRKNALDSVALFASASTPDATSSADEATADAAARNALLKFLKQQVEIEYRTKLENLRQLKKQAKEKEAASTSSSSHRLDSRRKLSTGASGAL